MATSRTRPTTDAAKTPINVWNFSYSLSSPPRGQERPRQNAVMERLKFYLKGFQEAVNKTDTDFLAKYSAKHKWTPNDKHTVFSLETKVFLKRIRIKKSGDDGPGGPGGQPVVPPPPNPKPSL